MPNSSSVLELRRNGHMMICVIMYQKDDTLLRRGFSDNRQQQQS